MYRTIAVLSVVLLVGLAGCGGPGPGAETTAEEPAIGDDEGVGDDGVGDTPADEPIGTPTDDGDDGIGDETPTDEGDGLGDDTPTDEDDTANIAP